MIFPDVTSIPVTKCLYVAMNEWIQPAANGCDSNQGD